MSTERYCEECSQPLPNHLPECSYYGTDAAPAPEPPEPEDDEQKPDEESDETWREFEEADTAAKAVHQGDRRRGVPIPEGAEIVPPPSDPLAVARHLAPTLFQRTDGSLTLRNWRGAWMRWSGPCWQEIDTAEVRADLYRRLENAYYPDGPLAMLQALAGEEEANKLAEVMGKPWAPNRHKIGDLAEAVAAVTFLSPSVDAPSWLDHDGGSSGVVHGVVACENGLLWAADPDHLVPLTPAFFNTVSVPFSYLPSAKAPVWEEFLWKLWPDEPDAIETLRQWFGYVLSGRTDLHKILLMVGPTRSGKGTIARVLEGLIGRGNVAGPTLASLGTNFGLSPLLGKPLAVVSDARLSGSGTHQVVERLLTISGEDMITVDRKYRELWTGKLPTRFVIMSNELPHFGDSSGVIARRFVVLTMTQSWLGREDTALTDKLLAELPGILNWALEGLATVERTGRLLEPASSDDAIVSMQDIASPMSAFVRECCEVRPDYMVTADQLWDAWKRWAFMNNEPCSTKQLLGRNLLAVVPTARKHRPRADAEEERRVLTYSGLRLCLSWDQQ